MRLFDRWASCKEYVILRALAQHAARGRRDQVEIIVLFLREFPKIYFSDI